MPQITLEYTANLVGFDAPGALRAINAHLAASGQFNELDIKSRALALQTFAIGTSDAPRGFVHLRLALLSGRSAEVRRQLSDGLLELMAAQYAVPAGIQMQWCAEVLEMDRESYAKRIVG